MARLTTFFNCSLDGFIEGRDGTFDWGAPTDEEHQYINDLIRPLGTYLYGRKNYETMAVWEKAEGPVFDSPVMQDFARIFRSAEKIIYSSTLTTVSTAKTRIERRFDPEMVRQLKAKATKDLGIGGPGLASAAWQAGLIDEVSMRICPVITGGGKRAWPMEVERQVELVDQKRFGSGCVFLRYRVKN